LVSKPTLVGGHLPLKFSTTNSHQTFNDANLEGADLSDAELGDAALSNANLTNAKVTYEQLSKCSTLQGATMPNGQKYEDWLKSREEDG
jgi:uncharacterized protein YjbI with pentapeptide repeats